MISLTPNMNCFGHMNLLNKRISAFVLNPQFAGRKRQAYAEHLIQIKPKQKVSTLFADMLKYILRQIFTIGEDEPFEHFPKEITCGEDLCKL